MARLQSLSRPAPTALARLVEDLLAHSRAKGHAFPLKRVFLPWCAREHVTEPAEVTTRLLDRLLNHLLEAGGARGPLSKHSVHSYLRPIKGPALPIGLRLEARTAGGRCPGILDAVIGHDVRVTGPRHVASELPGYREALHSPGFRRLWAAAVVSRAGDAINFVALPLLAYATTRSAAAVAALVIVEGVALVIGGWAAQFVIDRVEPRRLLVALDLGRAAAAGALAVSPTYLTALLVATMLALGTSWFSPTSGALVPRLVGRESLQAANAVLWTAGVVLQLVAAPLGGLLFTVASPRVAFGLNALSFVASALILAALPRHAALSTGSSPWRQFPEAVRAIRTVSVLRALIVMQALAALAVGATSALLVVLARRAYGLNGTGYGIWLAMVGVGALVGPVLVPALMRLAPSRAVPGAYLLRGVGDIGLGLAGNAVAGGGLLFLYGLNTSSGTVAFQTLVQESAPPDLRGRVFALLDVTWQTGRLASIALGGGLAVAVGIRPVFIGGGILLMGAGGLGWLTLGARRDLPATSRPARRDRKGSAR